MRRSELPEAEMPKTPSLSARLRREESGFTLIELVTVLGMLVIVMTALSYALISAHHAEEEMNRRFADRKSTRLNSSHSRASRMPSSA